MFITDRYAPQYFNRINALQFLHPPLSPSFLSFLLAPSPSLSLSLCSHIATLFINLSSQSASVRFSFHGSNWRMAPTSVNWWTRVTSPGCYKAGFGGLGLHQSRGKWHSHLFVCSHAHWPEFIDAARVRG